MSPLKLRRYRADRLLRTQFERLRASVLGGVAARLRTVGVRLDAADLEACYSQAWQGLYATVLEGSEIDSAEAWLANVTYRRAIDEHRARRRVKRVAPDASRRAGGGAAADATLAGAAPVERDLA
jgi:DNA-directed RNA polymerase specialized sigma24 family protein